MGRSLRPRNLLSVGQVVAVSAEQVDMEGSGLLSIYELGGLGAESCCKFEDRRKAWLNLLLFGPDQLPRGDSGRLGELLLRGAGRRGR